MISGIPCKWLTGVFYSGVIILVRKRLIWSVTPDWRKWARRVQPLSRSNRRTRMWCHPGRAVSERAMAVSRVTPRAPVTRAQCPGSWCVGVTRHVTPPPPPYRPVVTVGGHRSEESERNTTPRERREARGEERPSWMVWEWVKDLKKSIKIVPSYVCLVLRRNLADERCLTATKMRLSRNERLQES